MGTVNTLVTEVLAKLEHLVHAADKKPLKVELGGDAHHAVLVESVEVREERLRRGAAGLILEDWSLDFDETLGPKILANLHKETRTREKARASLIVSHEVNVTTAVALLLVDESVKLLWRLLESLRQHRPFLDDDRLLSLLSRKERAFGADDVAEI